MTAIEPGENPTHTITWKPLAFLRHIKCRTNDDRFVRFSSTMWESFFCCSLGVTTPALIGPSQQCACNTFHYDTFGDHLQTCQTKSVDSQVHDWVFYKLGTLLGSVGHKVKTHKITPVTGKDLGDMEIKDYKVLQKPQAQDNHLPPPRILIMDFTMTHVRFGRSHLYPIGQLTHTRRSEGAWTFQVDCMMISFVCFSSMITVRHRTCLIKCRRNRISFVSFVLCVSVI